VVGTARRLRRHRPHARIDAPKSTPADVASRHARRLEAGAEEVLADDISKQIKQSLSSATPAYAA
jgi:hypothetical protein